MSSASIVAMVGYKLAGTQRRVRRWHPFVGVVVGLALGLGVMLVASADQTSPYCTYSDQYNDKYDCATTQSYWDYSSNTRTITGYLWNGSLGNGGYGCCWQLYGIAVWDSLNGQPHLHAQYGAEGNFHNNEFFFSNPIGYVFNDYGVYSNSAVYYCFYFHTNPPYEVTNYFEWRNYPDSNSSWDGLANGVQGCP